MQSLSPNHSHFLEISTIMSEPPLPFTLPISTHFRRDQLIFETINPFSTPLSFTEPSSVHGGVLKYARSGLSKAFAFSLHHNNTTFGLLFTCYVYLFILPLSTISYGLHSIRSLLLYILYSTYRINLSCYHRTRLRII